MAKGPAANFARDRHGHVVNGLRVQKSRTNGERSVERFYALDAKGRRKYFGSSDDRTNAIRKFRRWLAQTGRETITIGQPIKDLDDLKGFEDVFARFSEGDEVTFTVHPDGTVTDESDVAADGFWEKVAEQVRTNPKLAAQKTGIEEFGYLDRLKPPVPSVTLAAIGQLYLDDKRSSITPAEWRNSKTWWDEFAQITGATRIADLDREGFRKYRNKILSEVQERRLSNTWARSRFGKIKTIINHARSEMDLGKDDRAMLELRSLLKPPSKPKPNPRDLTPTELRKILAKAGDWAKALILVALNCAYSPIDCQRLRWSAIDHERGTIRFDREKATGRAGRPLPRVAVLWPRTLKALRKLPRRHDHVFLSTVGRPVHIETIRRHWISLCERAGIERPLTFANLRDSALTAAAASADPAVPVQQYHVLAGHAAKGVDDNYISRHPHFVETACRAIERTYFGHR